MFDEDPRVSLADLSAVGVRLRASEAVTIVRELIRQVTRGSVPGMPSAHVIRFSPSGLVSVEGPVAAGGRAVSRAATLLDTLLPPFDAPPELRATGALRLTLARALGTMDLPPYESLEDFASALERFGEPDAELTIRRLTAAWARAAAAAAEPPVMAHQADPPPVRGARDADRGITASALVRRDPASLTISDIRRARRATGLPLADISERSRIPIALLRQLEWGYLHNWPAGLYGRTQLVRYARAAGLDEHVVTTTVSTLLDQIDVDRAAQLEAERERAVDAEIVAANTVEVTPAVIERELVAHRIEGPLQADPADVPLERVGAAEMPRHRRRWRAVGGAGLFAAAAVVALLAIPGLQDGSLLPSSAPAAVDSSPSLDGTAASSGTDVVLTAEGSAAPSTAPTETLPAEAGGGEPASPGAQPANLITEKEVPANPPTVPAAGLTDSETAWSPAFATVGSAMFYHAQEGRGGPSALVRADTDEEGAILRITRVVDDNAQNYHARPSPDGSQIAFDSDRSGERAVYVADAEGANVRRVSGDGFAAVPSWSPDGRTLAFVRAEPDRPRVWNLWLADLESGELRRLTSYRYGQPWGASWFPDGRRVAYSHEDRLVVLDIKTGRERDYPSPRKGRLIRTPAVSPDGDRIIFQVYRDGAWLLDLAEGSARKVLADPTAEEYAWSPDGSRVAYHSRRSGEWGVWVMLDK